jgi:hypothetical protein
MNYTLGAATRATAMIAVVDSGEEETLRSGLRGLWRRPDRSPEALGWNPRGGTAEPLSRVVDRG